MLYVDRNEPVHWPFLMAVLPIQALNLTEISRYHRLFREGRTGLACITMFKKDSERNVNLGFKKVLISRLGRFFSDRLPLQKWRIF